MLSRSNLLFIEKLPPAIRQDFANVVKGISRRHGINPNWLMGVMNSETGGSFDPAQRNLAGSGATGLIQFMPSTARDMGTTTGQLAAMDHLEQLTYVDDYISMQKRNFGIDRIKDYDDLYLLVFYPAAIGKPDEWAFPGSIYRQNSGVDVNKDGKITIADFKAFARRKIPQRYMAEFTSRYRWLTPRYMAFAGVALLALGVGIVIANQD